MSDFTPRRRPSINAFNSGGSRGAIKFYWQSQLRSPRTLLATQAAFSSQQRREEKVAVSELQRTVSTARSGGLTESSGRGTATPTTATARSSSLSGFISSTRRRCLREAALTAERRHSANLNERYGALARPLFQNYLLAQFEDHEAVPTLTVVLDLDETLVCNRNAFFSAAILRPYCLHMLNAIRHMKGIEVVLWTASTKETASPVVEQLSESGLVFDEVIYRNNLWFTEPVHTKDLRLLGRDMERVLIVDNAANCCKLNPQSAVLVDDFYGQRDEDDATLVNVYYMIERVFKGCQRGIAVKDALRVLEAEGHLCSSVELVLSETWRNLPLREIAPLKIPPHGHFIRARREPLGDKIMVHWTI